MRIERADAVRGLMLARTIVGSALLIFMACEESLPSFEEPSSILSARAEASYTYGVDNMITVSIEIKNLFDETLQNTAVLTGVVRITSKRVPGYSRSIQLSPGDLTLARDYDRISGRLTMDPGESVWMQVKWDFIDDLRRDLRQGYFEYTEDPTCSARKIADREFFNIEASVIVFDQIGHLRCVPIELSLCHIDRVISVRDCPPINPISACDIIEALP